MDPAATARFAQLFHALSDPTRLAIVQHLALGEHRVRDVMAHMSLAQSTVSAHLACLRDAGVVRSRAEGRASWFSLTDLTLVDGLIASAQRLLEGTGQPVALCAHLGAPSGGGPSADIAEPRPAGSAATAREQAS